MWEIIKGDEIYLHSTNRRVDHDSSKQHHYDV